MDNYNLKYAVYPFLKVYVSLNLDIMNNGTPFLQPHDITVSE